MTKIILLRILLFLVPFVIYWIYWRVVKGRSESGRPVFPVMILTICGLLLVAMSFVFLRATTGEGTDSTYVPSRYEDGRVIPPQNIPKEQKNSNE